MKIISGTIICIFLSCYGLISSAQSISNNSFGLQLNPYFDEFLFTGTFITTSDASGIYVLSGWDFIINNLVQTPIQFGSYSITNQTGGQILYSPNFILN